MPRRLRPEDLRVTERERQLANTAGSAGGNATAIGGGIGTALGAGVGALLGIPTAGALSAPLAGVGAGVGGALGSAIGGQLGQGQASEAEGELAKIEEQRQRQLSDWEMRQAALDDLLAQE